MIDTVAFKTAIIDLAVTGQLSSQFHAEDSVMDITAVLPPLSNKRKKLMGQNFEYGKQAVLPNHWQWVCLGKISSYGETPQKAYFDDVSGETWILDLEDIKSGGQIIKKTRVHGKKFIGEKTVFSKGQVLYSKLRPYLKKVLVADEDGISTPELISFDVFGGMVPQYIVYCLLSSFTGKAIEKRSYGIKMPRIDVDFMANLPIPVPPISEQQFIVDRVQAAFSEIDTIDELQAQYTDNLTVLKSKLIDLAIQGKLTEQLPEDGTAEELYQQIQSEKTDIISTRKGRKDNSILPVDENVPFDIPENWKWIRFGETGFFRKGPFGSSLTKSMFVPKSENTVKVYEQQHAINKDHTLGTYYITKEYFDTSMKGFEVMPRDIIVSCAGTIGETYIMPETIECGIINQALMRITVVPSIDKRFFLFYFDSQLKSRAKDGNGMAITNIPPFDILKNLYFPLPPLAEQKRIVDRLDKLLAVWDKLK